MLAVGHASRDARQQGEGHITLWTLKDPLQPINVISTPAGVTSIAWSKRTPVHVAVGLRSGIMAVYDARQQQATTPPISVHAAKAVLHPSAETLVLCTFTLQRLAACRAMLVLDNICDSPAAAKVNVCLHPG